MRILLEIDGLHPRTMVEMTEAAGGMSGGRVYRTAAGIEVQVRTAGGIEQKRGWPDIAASGQVMQFFLEWGGGEALSMVAGWIVGKLHGRYQTVRINRRTVPVNEASILVVLQEARGVPPST